MLGGLLVLPLGTTPHTVLVLPEFRVEEFLEAIELFAYARVAGVVPPWSEDAKKK